MKPLTDSLYSYSPIFSYLRPIYLLAWLLAFDGYTKPHELYILEIVVFTGFTAFLLLFVGNCLLFALYLRLRII
nr:MAG TPA: Mature oligodendrocyte transmembrane protein [Caudoviricetes sp.]